MAQEPLPPHRLHGPHPDSRRAEEQKKSLEEAIRPQRGKPSRGYNPVFSEGPQRQRRDAKKKKHRSQLTPETRLHPTYRTGHAVVVITTAAQPATERQGKQIMTWVT